MCVRPQIANQASMCLMNEIAVEIVLIMAKLGREILFIPKQNPIGNFEADEPESVWLYFAPLQFWIL